MCAMSLSKPTWSYASCPQAEPYMYQTIPDRISNLAKLHPKKEAFVDVDKNGERRASITFGELFEKATYFAKGLLKQGIVKGDVVAIKLPNSVEWLICSFGTLLAGGIAIYPNCLTKDGKEMFDAVKASKRCKLLITEPGKDDQQRQVCESIFGKLSKNGIIENPICSPLKRIAFNNASTSMQNPLLIKDILNAGKLSTRCNFPIIYPEDVATYGLTSGTTGTPKIIMNSHVFLLRIARDIYKNCELCPDTIYFNFQEMGWGGAYPYCLIGYGITRVSCVLEIINDSTDITSFVIKAIQTERCTFAMLQPKLLTRLSNSSHEPGENWRLRTVWSTGVPIPSRCAGIIPNFAEMFISAYGGSEYGMIAALKVRNPLDYHDFTVGRPVESTEIKIVDNEGNVVPTGVMGEVFVRRPVTFNGYLNSDECKKTKLGWLRTDDVGYMTHTGNFVITGRKSEAFKICNDVTDELIFPYTVETDIRKILGVEDVCVVPYVNKQQLTNICACIEVTEGFKLTQNEVDNVLRNEIFELEHIFSTFVPSYYVFFDKLPRNVNEKISRSKVTKEAKEKIESRQ